MRIFRETKSLLLLFTILINACSINAQEQQLMYTAQLNKVVESQKISQDDPLVLAVYFTGIKKGKDINLLNELDCVNLTADDCIYTLVYNLLKEGEKKAFAFFNKVHTVDAGKKFNAKGIHFFAGSKGCQEQIKRIKSPNALDEFNVSNEFKDTIPKTDLGISFFTLDDTIVLTETTSLGLKKVALYILVSFFVFNYEKRVAIYSTQFVIPLEANTKKKGKPENFVKDFLNEEIEKGKRFKNALKQMSISVLRDKWFKTVMTEKNLKRFHTLKSDNNFGQVSIGNILQKSTNTIQPKYQMKLNNENRFHQLAAYMATIRFCSEIPMIPPFVGDHNLMEKQKKALEKVIRKQLEEAAVLVRRQTNMNSSSNRGDDLLSGTFELKDVFPQPTYKFNLDIELLQKRVSKNSFRIEDKIYANMLLSVYNLKKQEQEIQPKKGKNKLKLISEPIEHSFAFGNQVKMTDAYFYNAMIKGMNQDRDIVIFDKKNNPNGIYETILFLP